MIEKRCKVCKRLLFRVSQEPRERIEIKCPKVRCGTVNTFKGEGPAAEKMT